MRILLVAATEMEVANVSDHINKHGKKLDFFNTYYADHQIYTLVTGIGTVATTYALCQIVNQEVFDLILNIGLAGSYDLDIPLGTVCQVTKDRFGDIGALERDESLLDVYDLKLADPDFFPYQNGWLKPRNVLHYLPLKQKSSVTLNTTSGSPTSITKYKQKYNPDLETMEGAAVFYFAMMKDIDVIQLRSVSNYVTLRDRESWQIKEAIAALDETILTVLEQLK